MENREPPSIFSKIIGPPLFLICGISATVWFFYRIFFLFLHITGPIIVFDKGSYYMLGVGIGLLSLGVGIAIEFWGGKPASDKQGKFISRSAISGVVLALIIPHLSHFSVDVYLSKKGYRVCNEASHQWLFVRDIVYIKPSVDCTKDLIKSQ